MKYYLMLTVLCCGLTVFSAEKSPREALNELKTEQKQVSKKIYELRLKLIKEDPALAKLHKRIMELHREMALKLESKKSMRIMIDKAAQLDQKIKDLEKKVPEETEE